jgi:hypothetical protein
VQEVHDREAQQKKHIMEMPFVVISPIQFGAVHEWIRRKRELEYKFEMMIIVPNYSMPKHIIATITAPRSLVMWI